MRIYRFVKQEQLCLYGTWDKARQPLCAARAGHKANVYLRLSQKGTFSCYSQVTFQRQLQTSAKSVAIDCRDERLPDLVGLDSFTNSKP
jgi:hypothetical protein